MTADTDIDLVVGRELHSYLVIALLDNLIAKSHLALQVGEFLLDATLGVADPVGIDGILGVELVALLVDIVAHQVAVLAALEVEEASFGTGGIDCVGTDAHQQEGHQGKYRLGDKVLHVIPISFSRCKGTKNVRIEQIYLSRERIYSTFYTTYLPNMTIFMFALQKKSCSIKPFLGRFVIEL